MATKNTIGSVQQNVAESHFPERIIDLIKSRSSIMPRGQVKVADYIIKNRSTFWLLSVQEVAKAVGVSHATVIRFCRALGYDGFSDFSRDVINIMKLEITVADRFSNSSLAIDETEAKNASLFKQVLSSEVDSLNALANSVSESDIKTCVDLMLQADAIYILGRMSSFPIALHFESTLSKVCNTCFLIPESELQAAAILKKMTKNSVLFSIAYTRYSTSTISFTEMAHEKGCRIVAITNSLLSPIVQHAALKFITGVKPLSFADLFVAPFALVTALSLEYSLPTKHQTADSLEEFDKIMLRRKSVVV
ncbi:MAG TPA: MurR/RpiR family transcriptional regulator [Klebsiella sp.]